MDSYKNASDSVLHRASRVRVAALGLISLLVSALIFAQTLGLMHQLAHGPHDQGTAQAGLHDHQAAEETGIHESDWLETLFASHEDGSNSCRVFDQQGQTALMTAVASLALPSVFRAALPLARITCHPTSAAASFEARAPPFSR